VATQTKVRNQDRTIRKIEPHRADKMRRVMTTFRHKWLIAAGSAFVRALPTCDNLNFAPHLPFNPRMSALNCFPPVGSLPRRIGAFFLGGY
jgi:hypothetical protein